MRHTEPFDMGHTTPKLGRSIPCIRYIHIALWVRKVVLNELDGGFHFKRPVRSLRIVPEEVSHQSDVELFWVKEFILVSRQYTPPGGCD